MSTSFVNALTIAADLGVYLGALAMIVAVGFGIAELVGLADRFLVERSIRRAFINRRRTTAAKVISRRRTTAAKVISLRQRRKVFGQRTLERRENGHG